MTALSLAQRVVALDRALDAVPHAFGGALALAYYAEPRATIDIDLNVFVPAERFEEVASPLRAVGVTVDEAVAKLVARDGQARAWWDTTPVDLFFAYDAFHAAAARARRTVPFADTEIPILSAEHLVVCKAVFNRAKDWIDIDAMLALGHRLDTAEVLRWVGRLAGDEDPRYERLAAVLTS
ncbi:MAG: nucleotidyl transferase AbiEii/AbiGii toxin family protein [Actinomycetota bacterium]